LNQNILIRKTLPGRHDLEIMLKKIILGTNYKIGKSTLTDAARKSIQFGISFPRNAFKVFCLAFLRGSLRMAVQVSQNSYNKDFLKREMPRVQLGVWESCPISIRIFQFPVRNKRNLRRMTRRQCAVTTEHLFFESKLTWRRGQRQTPAPWKRRSRQ